MNNKQELLAPASDVKSFYTACFRGADAIYMGLEKFNARSMAKNFTLEEYIDCIKYAHRLGKKVYLTLNTIIFSKEVKEALNLIYELYKVGLDAVILQDIGLATKIHEIFPDLNMHASTQMSVYSLEQVNFLKSLGFSRVVLARELTIDEIEYICKNTDVEIEVFVHGALCVCLSGQCLLSSTIGSRSANQGMCAQPCRMKYSLINKSKNKTICTNKYLLSKKDIFGIEMIDKLKKAGVYSFKIEGRNRSLEYIGCTVAKYRRALDNYKITDNDIKQLSQVFLRQSKSYGYLNGIEYKKSITDISPKNTGLFLGKVITKKGPYVKIKLSENIGLHDGFEIYDADTNKILYSSIITGIKNEDNKTVTKLDVGQYAWIGDVNKKISSNSIIYKTSSKTLSNEYSYTEKLKPTFNVKITISQGQKLKAESSVFDKNIVTYTDYIPQAAINNVANKDTVNNAFQKTCDEAINFLIQDIKIDGKLYVPVSKLNELRRQHIANVLNTLDENLNIHKCIDNKDIMTKINDLDNNLNDISSIKLDKNCNDKTLYIYKYDVNFNYDFKNYKRIYIMINDIISNKESIINYFTNMKTKLFIVIPNYTGKNVSKYINNNLEELVKLGVVAGILIGSFEHINLCKYLKNKYNIELIADYSFNIYNIYSAKFFKELGFDGITLSNEVTDENVEYISKIIDTEIVDNYITVMTSRYCVIGAFEQNRDDFSNKCNKPCINNKFVIQDKYSKEYAIVTDFYDCIMKIVGKISTSSKCKNISIRKCIL